MIFETYPSDGQSKAKVLQDLGISCRTEYINSAIPCERKVRVIAEPRTPIESFAVRGVFSA